MKGMLSLYVNLVRGTEIALHGYALGRGGGGGGGGGALTLVLGTHCKTDSRSCGCRLEKGGLSQTQAEGHFLLGL